MTLHEETAARLVRWARQKGATGAEASIVEGDEFEVRVRLGEIETLKEAGSCAAGVRVLFGQRAGSAYTSDLSEDGLRRMLDSAVELSRYATEDPFAGLPNPAALGKLGGDLELYSETVAALETPYKIEQARRAEQAALAADPRIQNSDGAGFGSYASRKAFANSLGFSGSYRSASCSISVAPVVEQNGKLERDYWAHMARRADKLEDAEYVGRRAAERVLRRLGARKVATQKVPVVFEPRVARSLLGHIFESVTGEAVYRKASFLAGRLGQKVAAAGVTVVDDGTLPGLFGTSPFDDEGVPSRRTTVIEDGVLTSYLLNSYAARKLGMQATGSASRGVTGNASTGYGNLFLEPGSRTAEELIGGVKRGLLVTELLGSGVNTVNGDYSRGAAGLWIEDGRVEYPVHEITISSNLGIMLEGIEAVANDLEFRGAIAAPTLLIREMIVSGS